MKVRGAATVLGLALALGMSGCSSSPSTTTGACNTLPDDGPTIMDTAVAAAAPTPAGGTLRDGVYALSSVTLYTGPGGTTAITPGTSSAVNQVAGTTLQSVGTINGVEKRYTSTFTTSGTTISTTDTCPAPSSDSFQFSASATAFSIYAPATGGTLEQTYTLR